MKWNIGALLLAALFYTNNAFPAGDTVCDGYNSPLNTFLCTAHSKGEGNCTWWAAHKRPELNFTHTGLRRDAKNWIWYAQQNDFETGSDPVEGAIAVFNNDPWGHVAYVETVNSDGSFLASEMGYDWFDGVRYSTYTKESLGGLLGFILPSEECATDIYGAEVCYHGSHTHTIHNDYRCSNSLCWAPGGETNCWDATRWWDEGKRLEDYDLLSEYVSSQSRYIPLNRDMCSEVYNAGDDKEGNGSGTSSDTEGPQLSIESFQVREKGVGDWRHAVNTLLAPGESRLIDGKLELANEGDAVAENVDCDYRVDSGRKFDTDDTKVDEDDCGDIDPDESITEYMRNMRVEVSPNGKDILVYDSGGSYRESVPLDETGNGKVYVFVDAEADNGDDELSSDHSGDEEYGVVHVERNGMRPIGFVDTSSSCRNIRGWAFDKDAGTGPIRVHIYENDTLIANVLANRTRSDLIAHVGSANHGFSYMLPASKEDGVRRSYKVYGINDASGQHNPLLTKGSFTRTCFPSYQNVVGIYRVANATTRGMYLTRNVHEYNGLAAPWVKHGIQMRAHSTQYADSKPVYKAFQSGKTHLFTINAAEYNGLPQTWTKGGVAFYAYASHKPGTTAVYRLRHPQTGVFYFTADPRQRDQLVSQRGFEYKAIAFWAFSR